MTREWLRFLKFYLLHVSIALRWTQNNQNLTYLLSFGLEKKCQPKPTVKIADSIKNQFKNAMLHLTARKKLV